MKFLAIVLLLFVASTMVAGSKQSPSTVREKKHESVLKRLIELLKSDKVETSVQKRGNCRSEVGMTGADANRILNQHNLLRSQEGATNMRKLRWSSELASIAQAWANTCKVEHGMMKDCSGTAIGQNLFYTHETQDIYDIGRETVAWWDEKRNWEQTKTYSRCLVADPNDCGHYPAVVWFATEEVGCGISSCKSFLKTMVACNYRSVVYQVNGRPILFQLYPFITLGTACSECPTNYGCHNGLCVPPGSVVPSAGPCSPNPCKNGAQCWDFTNDGRGRQCVCELGWEGDLCDEEPAGCTDGQSNSDIAGACGGNCKTSQVCTEGGCRGPFPWETPRGLCDPNPCKGGGACISIGDSFNCFCKDGYSGIWCEKYACDKGFAVAQPAPAPEPPTECKIRERGRDYTGKKSVTVSGRSCQAWALTTPHNPDWKSKIPSNFPEGNIEEASNYCRNPNDESDGPWCYTTDGNTRWEYCDIPFCDKCTPNICGSGGVCAIRGFFGVAYCQCKDGYSGVRCENFD